MGELMRLAERIPAKFIKKPPKGKYGKYVGHADIEQIALAKLGRPVSFEVVDYVRGYIPEWTKTDKDGKVTKRNPGRPQGIVACIARLTAVIDGETYVVAEVGEANAPDIHSDSENLKSAASDAYKRCWMRFGLGLELWVEQGGDPSPYFLHAQLLKDSGEQEASDTIVPSDAAPSDGKDTGGSESGDSDPSYPPGQEPFE